MGGKKISKTGGGQRKRGGVKIFSKNWSGNPLQRTFSYWVFTNHEYAQKQIFFTLFTIKVQTFYRQMDRAYTGFAQIKPQRLILFVGS